MSDQDYENTIGRLDDRIAELEAENQRLLADKERVYKAGYVDGFHESKRDSSDAMAEIHSYWQYFLEGK